MFIIASSLMQAIKLGILDQSAPKRGLTGPIAILHHVTKRLTMQMNFLWLRWQWFKPTHHIGVLGPRGTLRELYHLGGPFQCAPFCIRVSFSVDLSGPNVCMAKNVADIDQIYVCLHKVHRLCMPQNVGCNLFGNLGCSARAMFAYLFKI